MMGASHSADRNNSNRTKTCTAELDCSAECASKQKIRGRFSAARQRNSARFRRLLAFRRPTNRSKQELPVISCEKESNLNKADENMRKSAEEEIQDNSPYATGLAHSWRRSVKNCNVTQDLQQKNENLGSCFRPKSSNMEDLTHDVLLHIIRCFPFPSPRPSPRASPLLSPKPRNEPLRRSWSAKATTQFFPKKNNNPKEKASEEGPDSSQNSLQAALRNMAMNSVDTMAITALPLDCWLRERLKHWVQLSGHEGTIVPASDCTLWKKRSGTDCNEATCYRKLMNDALCPFVPKFTKEVEYKGESFIEIEDLTSHFKDPAIMDIKIGTRTFLEAEVKNPVSRKDLYQKMTKLDPSEPNEVEHKDQAVTKLRYMQFRERESSTAILGFRIEAMKRPGHSLDRSFQKVKTRDQVMDVLCKFMGQKAPVVRGRLLDRLRAIRSKVENSEFFRTHEVIGSSLLFMYDDHFASVWMIDFAKALPVDNGLSLDHRSSWTLGNHEDGYLTGLDNLVQILEDSKYKELSTL